MLYMLTLVRDDLKYYALVRQSSDEHWEAKFGSLANATSIASGYNRLAELSKAGPDDILGFVHEDVRFGFDASRVAPQYMDRLESPGVLGFCGSAKYVPGRQWHTCPPLYGGLRQGPDKQILQFIHPTRWFSYSGMDFRYEMVQVLDGYALFIRRSAFDRIGGFDEGYAGWHGYDMELCARALRDGFRNYVIDQPTCHLSWGSGGPQLDAALERLREKWTPMFNTLCNATDGGIAQRPVAPATPAPFEYVPPPRPKKGKLKLHIYTIAKNERQFCERFAETCKSADGVHVLDTGSTDGTPEALAGLGVHVKVTRFDPWKTLPEYDALMAAGKNPWRFDVARNLSINMVDEDADVLLSIDLDEILVPNWREIIERSWTPGTNHGNYKFAWSMHGDKPGHIFWYNKMHSRRGYLWVAPVHEAIVAAHDTVQRSMSVNELIVKHYPDPGKSRGQYLGLLELGVRESPNDVRTRFYYSRELVFYGRWRDGIASHMHYLSMPGSVWGHERSNSCIQIARCHANLKSIAQAEAKAKPGRDADAQVALHERETRAWLLKAVAEDSTQRDAWVELADYGRISGDNLLGVWAARKALELGPETDDGTYLRDPEAWGAKPHDVASVAGWYAANVVTRERSRDDAWNALAASPFDERLAANYALIQNLITPHIPGMLSPVPVADVLMLSYSKTEKEYTMAKRAINSLRRSSPTYRIAVTVIETNERLPAEPFAAADRDALFGPDVQVVYPGGKFCYNKFLQVGFARIRESAARYIIIMNNDVVLFNHSFIDHMLAGLQPAASASPLGLREAAWGFVGPEPIQIGYNTSVHVNGWFLMFDRHILNAIPFERLFPEEFSWYGTDNHYANTLERCGYKHALVRNAQALHLQRQSGHLLGQTITPPPTRDAMLSTLGMYNKRCVEVGVESGAFSEKILALGPESLLLIDPWKHQRNDVYPESDPSNCSDDEFERRYKSVVAKFGQDKRVTIKRDYSLEVAKTIPDATLDFVYIDAVHTKAAVAADIAAWWPKLKPGAWLCGHDFQYQDVAGAVQDFCSHGGAPLAFVTGEVVSSWGVQKP